MESCQLCDDRGHVAKDCPKQMRCQLCNTVGHTAKSCRSNERCFRCKEQGHRAINYPRNYTGGAKQRPIQPTVFCNSCNKPGHIAATCSYAQVCAYCKNRGHHINACRNRIYNEQQSAENENGASTFGARREAPRNNVRSANMMRLEEEDFELLPL